MPIYTALQERLVLTLVDKNNITPEAKATAVEALCAMSELELEEEIEAYLDKNPSAAPDELMAFIRSFYPEYEIEE